VLRAFVQADTVTLGDLSENCPRVMLVIVSVCIEANQQHVVLHDKSVNEM